MLDLLVELVNAERPKTKEELRVLPGYAELDDAAFESQFQRDKTTLRQVGILLDIHKGPVESYSVAADSFARSTPRLDDVDRGLIQLAVSAWQPHEADLGLIDPKIAAGTDAHAPAMKLSLGLEGAQSVALIARALSERRIVSFVYPSREGSFARAVEPWRLVIRGRALYLWGRDLDRQAERLFRLSRFESEVEFLGEPGDAGAAPRATADPFDAFLVSPRLLLRQSGARRIRSFVQETDAPSRSGWCVALGEPAEIGEWIMRILYEAEDVVVLGPEHVRAAILERVQAGALWGSADA